MAPSNSLPMSGNEKTMNLNSLVLANIQASPYFKCQLFELKTYHQVIDEIYYKVNHLEPWEKGSRKTAGQTGMCGGVRGVGTGGIVSSAYCLLFKLYTLKLTRKQLIGICTHKDSTFIRGLGLMYIRYTQPPNALWDMLEPYLDDEEEVDPKAGAGNLMTIGEMAEQLLVKLEWYGTLFPRIPVPIQKDIERKLDQHKMLRGQAKRAGVGWREERVVGRREEFLDKDYYQGGGLGYDDGTGNAMGYNGDEFGGPWRETGDRERDFLRNTSPMMGITPAEDCVIVSPGNSTERLRSRSKRNSRSRSANCIIDRRKSKSIGGSRERKRSHKKDDKKRSISRDGSNKPSSRKKKGSKNHDDDRRHREKKHKHHHRHRNKDIGVDRDTTNIRSKYSKDRENSDVGSRRKKILSSDERTNVADDGKRRKDERGEERSSDYYYYYSNNDLKNNKERAHFDNFYYPANDRETCRDSNYSNSNNGNIRETSYNNNRRNYNNNNNNDDNVDRYSFTRDNNQRMGGDCYKGTTSFQQDNLKNKETNNDNNNKYDRSDEKDNYSSDDDGRKPGEEYDVFKDLSKMVEADMERRRKLSWVTGFSEGGGNSGVSGEQMRQGIVSTMPTVRKIYPKKIREKMARLAAAKMNEGKNDDKEEGDLAGTSASSRTDKGEQKRGDKMIEGGMNLRGI